MALPVPKTMFQHMLKEGAKVCLDAQSTRANFSVLTLHMCKNLLLKVGSVGDFDTQVTSPVVLHVRSICQILNSVSRESFYR